MDDNIVEHYTNQSAFLVEMSEMPSGHLQVTLIEVWAGRRWIENEWRTQKLNCRSWTVFRKHCREKSSWLHDTKESKAQKDSSQSWSHLKKSMSFLNFVKKKNGLNFFCFLNRILYCNVTCVHMIVNRLKNASVLSTRLVPSFQCAHHFQNSAF